MESGQQAQFNINTRLLTLDGYKSDGKLSDADMKLLHEAARIIRESGLVAFPTETVYGLGGNALMKDASRRIYAAKGRPSDNPLIVHIASIEDLDTVARDIPDTARLLAERFWPGPMTMVLKKQPAIPDETTGGLDTVAVRFPVHPAAMELIRLAGVPVAAPSANLSGKPSTTSAGHCIEDLTGRVDAIVDGGDSDIGLESTIIDLSSGSPQLLRPGAVTREMLEETLGHAVNEDAALKGPLAEGIRPKAPGMKYRHYAPKAPMVLVMERADGAEPDKENETALMATGMSDGTAVAAELIDIITEKKSEGVTPALLCSAECLERMRELNPGFEDGVIVKITGSRADRAQIAHNLFDELRQMDHDNAGFIAAEGYAEDSIGSAVMNRMKKASAWQVIYV